MKENTYKRSEELYKEALQLMPGGVNSPVRAFRHVDRTPVFIASAAGSRLTDVDGNQYIDYVCSWGPCILGHSHPDVIEKVRAACEKGLSYGAPTENEVTLARMIRECMPAMESLRLVSSGTEAVMSAIRAARGFTRRDKIVKFKGCYHGHSDGLLVKAGSGVMDQAVPDSLGVPVSCTENTLVALYNDESSVEELFESYQGQIAAVVVEPVAANMGVVLPEPGYLAFLRRITEENGALLLFDEVITGFRLAPGGAAEYYGIRPDLITLGKIVGGGMPVGAYGGRKEIMDLVSPSGGVYQAGTLSGNPVATTAGIETLRILMENREIYCELEAKGAKLEEAMYEAFGRERIRINRVGSLISLFFINEPVKNYDTVMKIDTARYKKYFSYLLDHGIYIAPSPYEAMFLSAAHSEEDLDQTIQVIRNFAGQ